MTAEALSLHPPERDRAGERARPRADRAAIIAAVDDPLAVGRLSGDDPDMMAPDHHDADAGATRIHAFTSPWARPRKAPIRFAEIFAQVTSTPGVRSMSMMPGARLGLNGKNDQDRRDNKEGF